jgi:cytochrome c oxidase assembly protein subunit 11
MAVMIGGKPDRNLALALALVSLVAGMVGMSYAAVPLYRLFCEVTGYGGTTQRALAGADRTLDREVVVRFDANVSGLPWAFRPEVPEMHVRLGETALVSFVAENTGDVATVGTAIFNVQPSIAGVHFNKIECFCFVEQTLQAGERIEMPVQFFISPEFAEDRGVRAVRTLTLSYTFFPAEGQGQPVAQASGDEGEKRM